MRFLIAVLGAAVVVVVLMLIAAGIYGAFPDAEELISVSEIDASQIVLDEDYTIEGLLCDCQSDQLENEIEETGSGRGCRRSILSTTQKRELPACKLTNINN